ncbi:elongation factor 1-gamma (EF-1-gamma), putative, partial [Trypanosoma cruzi]
GRGSRGCEGLPQAQGGQQDAVHDGQPDPRVVPAHGARAQVRVRCCTHDWGGEAARRCGAVGVVWRCHAGGCEDVEDTELFDWEEVADVAAQRECMTDCLCWEGPTILRPVLEGRVLR